MLLLPIREREVTIAHPEIETGALGVIVSQGYPWNGYYLVRCEPPVMDKRMGAKATFLLLHQTWISDRVTVKSEMTSGTQGTGLPQA